MFREIHNTKDSDATFMQGLDILCKLTQSYYTHKLYFQQFIWCQVTKLCQLHTDFSHSFTTVIRNEPIDKFPTTS